MSHNIDFATFTILTGTTATATIPAGHWLIFATVNALTQATGSFQSTITWFGIPKLFQGYRAYNENRTQSEFTYLSEINISSQTTYTCTATGTAATDFEQNRWLAIKLG